MTIKNDGVNICVNCGVEMVKMRLETQEGDWVIGWLCECEEAAEQDAAPDAAETAQQYEAIRRFNRTLLAIGPVLNPPRG